MCLFHRRMYEHTVVALCRRPPPPILVVHETWCFRLSVCGTKRSSQNPPRPRKKFVKILKILLTLRCVFWLASKQFSTLVHTVMPRSIPSQWKVVRPLSFRTLISMARKKLLLLFVLVELATLLYLRRQRKAKTHTSLITTFDCVATNRHSSSKRQTLVDV